MSNELIGHLKKLQEVRVAEVYPFKAIVSGFGAIFAPDGSGTIFDKVFGSMIPSKKHLFKKPFITGEPVFFQTYCPHLYKKWPCEDCPQIFKGQFVFAVEDSVTEADAAPYEIINFKGGLFAVTTNISEDEASYESAKNCIDKWLETSGFEYDYASDRLRMSMMLNHNEDVKASLGFAQEDMYVPVKLVEFKYETAISLTAYNEGGQIIEADYAKIKAAPKKSVIRIFVENIHKNKECRMHWGCGWVGNSSNPSNNDGFEFKGASAGELKEYKIPVACIKGPFTNVYNDCKINKLELWIPK
jgi:hypothetical protein